MKKLIMTIKGEITEQEPFVVVLPDKVEGNDTLNFILKEDAERPVTHTTIDIFSEREANVYICNAPKSGYTSVKEDMILGTYQSRYKLYVNYVMDCNSEGVKEIEVKFYKEEE